MKAVYTHRETEKEMGRKRWGERQEEGQGVIE